MFYRLSYEAMHWKQELTTDLAPNIWSIIGTASHVGIAEAMG